MISRCVERLRSIWPCCRCSPASTPAACRIAFSEGSNHPPPIAIIPQNPRMRNIICLAFLDYTQYYFLTVLRLCAKLFCLFQNSFIILTYQLSLYATMSIRKLSEFERQIWLLFLKIIYTLFGMIVLADHTVRPVPALKQYLSLAFLVLSSEISRTA